MPTLTKNTKKGKTQDENPAGSKYYNLFLRMTPEVRIGLRMIAAQRDSTMQKVGLVAITEFVERNNKG